MAFSSQAGPANRVVGDAGDNVLTGGPGDDVFVMSSGNDVITDFAPTRAGTLRLIDFEGERIERPSYDTGIRFGAQIKSGYLGLDWSSGFYVVQNENGLALTSGTRYGANWNSRTFGANEVISFTAPAEDFDLLSGYFAIQRRSTGLGTVIEAWDDRVKVGEARLDFSETTSFVDFQAGSATNLYPPGAQSFSGRFTSIDKVVFRGTGLLEMDDLLLLMGGGDRIAVPAGTDIGALIAGATSDGHGGTLLRHEGGQLDLRGIAPANVNADWFAKPDGDRGYNVITWDPRGEYESGGALQIDSPAFEGRDVREIIDWVSRTAEEPGHGVTAVLKNAFGSSDYYHFQPVHRPTNDAYIVLAASTFAMPAATGVLANDHAVPGTVVELSGEPFHGTVAISADGGFSYTPADGFLGVDAFEYRLADGSTAVASVFVVPATGGATPTLVFDALTAEEQIASIYLAFLGRGADRAGFDLWVDLVYEGLPARAAGTLGVGAEAKALYPLLANPSGSTDGEISRFLETAYDVLFDRAPDHAGLAYWMQETRSAIVGGRYAGQVLVEIVGGAQNSGDGQDITTLMSKVAVSIEYVEAQRRAGSEWTLADDQVDAIALLAPVTDLPSTVLAGIRNAHELVSADLA